MDDALVVSLLAEYARTRERELRDRLFDLFLPLAGTVARRFLGRGAEEDDLRQVAAMALLKALERFDPERGFRFVTFAVPTITGDLRNYLRDRADGMRMPRDIRHKLYRMRQEQERFAQRFLREPSARELAEAMEITPDELLLLLQSREQSETTSLDAGIGEEESGLSAFLGKPDEGYDRVEDREWMRWALSKVNDTEKELIRLRYQEAMGQRETAKRLGISQMQVSRIERRMLTRLRAMEQSGA